MNKKKLFKFFQAGFGMLILLALLTYVDLSSFYENFKKINIIWLPAVAAVIALSTLIGAYKLHLLVKYVVSIDLRTFVKGYWMSWGVGLIVPGQVGDIAAISLWLRRRGYDLASSGVGAVIDKVITLVWMLFFSALCIPRLSEIIVVDIAQSKKVLTSLALAFFGVILIVVISLIQKWKIEKVFAAFMNQVRNNRKSLFVNMILAPIKIAILSASYWLVFRSVGVELSFWVTMPLVCLSSLIAYLPISFNGIGTVELAAASIFLGVGVSMETTIACYLTLRVLVMLLAWLPIILLYPLVSKQTN